ncbi:hypothetical protein QTP86_005760 [Hemibagrus guttatus]|nr:hypothetical protein QTP86_005760 [Hemibagrus guttatus]
MTACRAATLFTLLLNYLASSKGALSPPLNLSVELLDFKALAQWLPGPGNPKGTRYSLEFIDIEHFSLSPWIQTGDCTNITTTQCYLIFNQRILSEYFIRVVAKWKDERSEWTCLPRSFQPYKYNLEKAYDRVPREELWYCMRKSGVAEKYVRVVQDMYERSRTVVRCAVGQTEEFKVEVGLHQGSALSPFLFAIVMDQLSEEVRQESPWTMMFADDIVICSESREQVEENLERWRFALERRGMKFSHSKTEYMCVNEREGSGTVRLQGEEVKKVQELKYLGSTVQSNGECGKEVKKRVQAGWNGWRKVSGVLCDRKISARIKGKVYRTVVRPAMLYGLETVSLRKRQESELEVAELKMLRFSLGVTRLDRIRNEYIRGTAHVGRLGVKVREARLRWFGHVQRRETLLSAPELLVSTEQNSIWISLSHPVQLLELRMRFSVDLFQMININKVEKHIAQNITTKSSCFVNLPPGIYCINASAFLTADGHKSNQNATMCVVLHLDPNEGYLWLFIVAVLPLLSIPPVVGLILIYYYVKPSKNSCIPKAMEIIEGTGIVRILNPEDPRALPISWLFIDDSKSVHQESVEDSSEAYYGVSDIKFKNGLLAQSMDEADQDTPPVRDLYRTAVELEDDRESLTETECCSDGLTLNTTTKYIPRDQIRNSLDSVLFAFGENTSCYFEQTESEAETESLCSDAFCGSNYEPRPDPRWMPNL